MFDSLIPVNPATLRELVHRADVVPEDDVIELIPKVLRKIQGLAEGNDRQAYLRHLVVLGALVNRAIFEVCDVAKSPDTVL